MYRHVRRLRGIRVRRRLDVLDRHAWSARLLSPTPAVNCNPLWGDNSSNADTAMQIEGQVIALLPIEAEHVLALDDLPVHHNEPFDRLFIAQARTEQMTLVRVNAAVRVYAEQVNILCSLAHLRQPHRERGCRGQHHAKRVCGQRRPCGGRRTVVASAATAFVVKQRHGY